ncbi:MAG TPA: hypothetical protein PLL30_00260 [Candidatus Krumholzibacteria bacterium]|nr:hypothetical protein [Candidatus Krumholzibacteria bacterium]HPD70191.1 hypothetical protein [Candidatus Krumholzibacteria bacterium]HRY40109.1 hypothetical protein [Candidatus Krumholzibacteria bacterium]
MNSRRSWPRDPAGGKVVCPSYSPQILNGNYTTNPKYAGDFNNDNFINLSDIVRMTKNIGTHCN